MTNCHACGQEKDQATLEVYPFHGDFIVQDRPIRPLFHIQCDHDRYALVCHSCFHRLQPDMWIEQAHWDALNPTTPYDQLPPEEIPGTPA